MHSNHNIHHPYFLYRLFRAFWWVAIIFVVLCLTGASFVYFGAFAVIIGFFAGFFTRYAMLKHNS